MDIKRYRIFNEIPPIKVCEALGIGRSTLSRYESGSHFPRPEMLLKIRAWSGGQVDTNDFLAKRK